MIVEIRNLDKVERFVRELPKKLDNQMTLTNTRFMKAVRKSAKLRAPKDTGELAESIKLLPIKRGKNIKKWRLRVNAPHALFQEVGFKPHWAPIMGSRKMTPGFYYVAKWKPFLEPALQKQLIKFNQKINRAVRRAL